MAPDLEIICVGNELLIGKIPNTNAQWLSRESTNLGISVKRITVVSDNVAEIANAIQETLRRKPKFIITTGGLGPTFDDKTLEGIAKALNRKLEVNPKALQMVKEKYEAYATRIGTKPSELTAPQVKMATIPEKTQPIPNPVGTAPGVQANLKGTVLIVLPGVPSEMEAIFEKTVSPMLKQASSGVTFHEKSVYADDIMESNLAPLIDKAMKDNPGVYVKSHPRGAENKPHLELHLSITAKDNENAEERLQKTADQLARLIERNGGKAYVSQYVEG
jgi:molybdenum cofactor synthesis domain-containing protein